VNRPSASIVVATHARSAFLADCISSIAEAMNEGDEMIVVDCCSDGAPRVEGERAGSIKYVRGAHASKTAKLNAATREASGDVLLITDDDCRVAPGWVDAMARPFANPVVGVAFGPVTGLSAAPGAVAPVIPPGAGPPELWFYTHGAAMAVRREALFDVGGFDERLGPGAVVHGEEADVVVRMLAGGWTCEVADAPTVEHLEWRDEQESLENLFVYQRGLGAYLGTAVHHDWRRALKLVALRLRNERVWWEDRRTRGASFGPRMSTALVKGFVTGVRLRPQRFLDLAPDMPRSTARPSVLWVTDEPPDHHRGGGCMRQAKLLDGLRAQFDVTLVVVGRLRDEDVRRAVTEVLELPEPRPERQPKHLTERRVRDLWQALVRRLPTDAVVTARGRRILRPVLARLADDFDLVIVQHLSLARLLPARRRARWLIEVHNVPSARARQEAEVAPGRRQRWLLSREAAKAARYERRAVGAYDGVIAVTDEDAAAIAGQDRGHARGPVVVVPNGVDTAVITPTPLPHDATVLLPASLNYRPNILGAVWFCDEVLPLVQSKVPEVEFHLVGRQPVRDIVDLAQRPGIDVHGDVPRMAPWFERARVVVVPLWIGTGTRLKALEAMAAGRPLVGTGIGLEGLGIVDGVHARVVDDATAMAEAVVELLTDDTTAEATARAAREHVEQHFEWEAIARHLVDELQAMVERHGA
jgi:glycosyltransferase involved in cell wall biosynthesis/GT2 family glycosyltransferase